MNISKNNVLDIVKIAFNEDLKGKDHSSIACIDKDKIGHAKVISKENGIVAGLQLAKWIFEYNDPKLKLLKLKKDGDFVKKGDTILEVSGNLLSILRSERIVLNFMQRMSAIATKTSSFVKMINNKKTKLLDTRKTTPGNRIIEKWAVNIGGGVNHRFGLYDMILIKDNHIDFCGGVKNAINKCKNYIDQKKLDIKLVIEARNLSEVKQIINLGRINRIILDNFTINETKKALILINKKFEVESSGNINIKNIANYADCGVDYISVGALTHSINNFDLSLISSYKI